MTLEPTKFAPAARATAQALAVDHDLVASQAVLVGFLSTVSSQVAVLNPERQIVFASDDFLKGRGLVAVAPLLGKRPGEALNCSHSVEEEGGCGASEGCSVCGAIEAILESRRVGSRVDRECRLTVRNAEGTGTLDLAVTSTPWVLDGRDFTVLTVKDTGDEKRKQALERIFFHDIVNTAGGLAGILDLLGELPDLNEGKELVGMSRRSSQDILEEVLSFQQLKMAESGELSTHPVVLFPREVVTEAADKLRFHPVAEGRFVVVDTDTDVAPLVSDRLLLERVLVNMLKNAIEATPVGGEVRIGLRGVATGVQFFVHNPTAMPRPVQLQVFQRSFSTKAADRGLGTYSMRLLGETYLGGQVAFSSGAAGTEFTITLPKGTP
jgi:hypothetical protein